MEIAVSDLAIDPELRGAPASVLMYLSDPSRLPRDRFEPLKIAPLSHVLQIHRTTVTRALDTLVSRGLIEAGHMEDRVRTYRMVVQIVVSSEPRPHARKRPRRAAAKKGWVGKWQ